MFEDFCPNDVRCPGQEVDLTDGEAVALRKAGDAIADIIRAVRNRLPKRGRRTPIHL
jgi:hypothetical protein